MKKTMVGLLLICICVPAAQAQSKLRVCLDTDDGKITTRKRCRAKKNEVTATVALIADFGSDSGSEDEDITNTETVEPLLNNETSRKVTATCPNGQSVSSGGCGSFPSTPSIIVADTSGVTPDGARYACAYQNLTGTTITGLQNCQCNV